MDKFYQKTILVETNKSDLELLDEKDVAPRNYERVDPRNSMFSNWMYPSLKEFQYSMENDLKRL